MFALAVGVIVRRGAVAVTIVIVTVVLPYFLSLAAVVPSGAADWLLRITPAAGFAVQRRTHGIRRSAFSTRSCPGTTRSARGPGLRCCAAGRRWRWPARLYLLRRRDA